MTRFIHILALTLLSLTVAGCVADPLPMPPTVTPTMNVEAITMFDDGDTIRFEGSADAISEGNVALRFSAVAPPFDGVAEDVVGTSSNDDGSFVVTLSGELTYRFFVEALIPDTEAFLGALAPVCLMCTGPLEVGMADSGTDRDGDGSPDVIDCAPDDEDLLGQQCE